MVDRLGYTIIGSILVYHGCFRMLTWITQFSSAKLHCNQPQQTILSHGADEALGPLVDMIFPRMYVPPAEVSIVFFFGGGCGPNNRWFARPSTKQSAQRCPMILFSFAFHVFHPCWILLCLIFMNLSVCRFFWFLLVYSVLHSPHNDTVLIHANTIPSHTVSSSS